ncbi:hypothetical protein [Cellulosimicrobium cellulans]|uniref:hypothetical protein n=1 Tax=Cellulosimicrobium cellulans TaxID=1710 RepID=UPI00130E6324|nr:hypothetical protein [Cellulosimicrobium cellulans]
MTRSTLTLAERAARARAAAVDNPTTLNVAIAASLTEKAERAEAEPSAHPATTAGRTTPSRAASSEDAIYRAIYGEPAARRPTCSVALTTQTEDQLYTAIYGTKVA